MTGPGPTDDAAAGDAAAGEDTATGAVAILGCGKIGEALLSGLLRGARGPADIVVSEKYAGRA